MVGIHERAKRLGLPALDGLPRLASDLPGRIEQGFVMRWFFSPEASHVAHRNSGRAGYARIPNNDGERLGDVQGLDGLASYKIYWHGVGNHRIVNPGGRAVMQFLDLEGQRRYLLIG